MGTSEPGAEIIYGHHEKRREELAEMIQEGRWDDLLKKVPVKKGDFFYFPSGTIHAIGKGIMILETQQSSDTTYRVSTITTLKMQMAIRVNCISNNQLM